MTFIPNVNQVVVKQIIKDKTNSGFILADPDNQENKIGEIVATAKDFFCDSCPFTFPFAVGDRVIFTTFASPFNDSDDTTNKFYILSYNEIKSKIV